MAENVAAQIAEIDAELAEIDSEIAYLSENPSDAKPGYLDTLSDEYGLFRGEAESTREKFGEHYKGAIGRLEGIGQQYADWDKKAMGYLEPRMRQFASASPIDVTLGGNYIGTGYPHSKKLREYVDTAHGIKEDTIGGQYNVAKDINTQGQEAIAQDFNMAEAIMNAGLGPYREAHKVISGTYIPLEQARYGTASQTASTSTTPSGSDIAAAATAGYKAGGAISGSGKTGSKVDVSTDANGNTVLIIK